MPQLLLFDRVWETTTTTGTGSITLAGAKTGYQSFSVVGDGNTVPYCITDGTNFEIGQGTYIAAGTILSRDVVYSSTNFNNLINFGAGTKDVFITATSNLLTQINIEDTIKSTELISGGRAVEISQSGYAQIAMASVSGRMPAIGVVVDNVASGLNPRIYNRGRVFSSLFNFSGYIGSPAWVGTSGEIIVSAAPTLSGNVQQTIGVVISHSGLFLKGISSGSLTTSGSIASGSIGQFHLASGAVNSGHISSGSVIGSLGGAAADCIASGTIGPFDLGSGSVTSGAIASGQIGTNHLGSGSVTSGAIASGQIGTNHLASGAVTSGSIASGSIGQFHLASGAVNSGQVGSGAITASLSTGADCIASGTIGPFDLGSGSILSGAIASGQIGINHLGSGVVRSGAIASGSVARFHLASGAVNSGQVGSGAVMGSLGPVFNIASGTIGPNDFGSGAILSGAIASGQIGINHLASGVVRSGAIASGQIGQFHLSSGAVNSGHQASGFVVTFARNTIEDTYLTGETVSGFKPVAIASNGSLVVAQGASGLRMPAVGVTTANQLSGQAVILVMMGKMMVTSGLNLLWSGNIGQPLYVSTSGHLVTPTKPVTGLAQRIGICISGGMLIMPEILTQSGNAALQSGN